MIKRSRSLPMSRLRSCTSAFVAFSFTLSLILSPTIVCAQSLSGLPEPGTMVTFSEEYQPAMVKGIQADSENPLMFDFIIDKGESGLEGAALEQETQKLVKYFLSALTIPDDEIWVNLSPYEKDLMVPSALGLTEMGKEMLAQDYLLKQITASLTNPEVELGKDFWERVYSKAFQLYGTKDVPVNTFSKVWIVPDKAVVLEKEGRAFVVENQLKVMLEEDYLAIEKNLNNEEIGTDQLSSERVEYINNFSAEIVKEVIIPELIKEVNGSKNFASIRQIYNSVILATWYKKALKESLLGQVYVDKNKIAGVDVDDKTIKDQIYLQYLDALQQGVYDMVRDDYDPGSDSVLSRRYFSGGVKFNQPPVRVGSLDGLSNVRQRQITDLTQAIKTGRDSNLTHFRVNLIQQKPLPGLNRPAAADAYYYQRAASDRAMMVVPEAMTASLARELVGNSFVPSVQTEQQGKAAIGVLSRIISGPEANNPSAVRAALRRELPAVGFAPEDVEQASVQLSQPQVIGSLLARVAEQRNVVYVGGMSADAVAGRLVESPDVSVRDMTQAAPLAQLIVKVAQMPDVQRGDVSFQTAVAKEMTAAKYDGDIDLLSLEVSQPQVIGTIVDGGVASLDTSRQELAMVDAVRATPTTAVPVLARDLVSNPGVTTVQDAERATAVIGVLNNVLSDPNVRTPSQIRTALKPALPAAGFAAADIERASLELSQPQVLGALAARATEQQNVVDISGMSTNAVAAVLVSSVDVTGVRDPKQATPLARSMVKVAQMPEVQRGEVAFQTALAADLVATQYAGNIDVVSMEASQPRVLTQLSADMRFTPVVASLQESASQPAVIGRIAQDVVANDAVGEVASLPQATVVARAALAVSGKDNIRSPVEFETAMRDELTALGYTGDVQLASSQMSRPAVLARISDVARSTPVTEFVKTTAPETATPIIAAELFSNSLVPSINDQQTSAAAAKVFVQTVQDNPGLMRAGELRPVLRENLVKANIPDTVAEQISIEVVQQPVLDQMAIRGAQQKNVGAVGTLTAAVVAPQLLASQDVSVQDLTQAAPLAQAMVKVARLPEVQSGRVTFQTALAGELTATNFSGDIDLVSQEASQPRVLAQLGDSLGFVPVKESLRTASGQVTVLDPIARDIMGNRAVGSVTSLPQAQIVARAALNVSNRENINSRGDFEAAMTSELTRMNYTGNIPMASSQVSQRQVLSRISEVARFVPAADMIKNVAPEMTAPLMGSELIRIPQVTTLTADKGPQAEEVAKVFVKTLLENPEISSAGDLRVPFRTNLENANVPGVDAGRVSQEVGQQTVMDQMAMRVAQQMTITDLRTMNADVVAAQLDANPDVTSVQTPQQATQLARSMVTAAERNDVQTGQVLFSTALIDDLKKNDYAGDIDLTGQEASQPQVLAQLSTVANRAQTTEGLALRAMMTMPSQNLAARLNKHVPQQAAAMVRQIESIKATNRSAFLSQPAFERAAPEIARVLQTNKRLVGDLADVGGIDLNAAFFDFKVKGDGSIKIPVALKEGMEVDFGGLEPVVVEIGPAALENLPFS